MKWVFYRIIHKDGIIIQGQLRKAVFSDGTYVAASCLRTDTLIFESLWDEFLWESCEEAVNNFSLIFSQIVEKFLVGNHIYLILNSKRNNDTKSLMILWDTDPDESKMSGIREG